MIAKVIINNNSLATDRLFDYKVPAFMEAAISVGHRVKIPFGRSNATKEAYVYSLAGKSEYSSLKEIIDFMGDEIYFDEKKAKLIDFMRHRYFCSYISALRSFIPAGVGAKFTRYFSINEDKKDEISKACAHSLTADKIIATLRAYGTLSEEDISNEVGKKNVGAVLNKLLNEQILILSTSVKENIKDKIKTFVELVIEREEAYRLVEEMQKKAKARSRALEIIAENSMIELSELLLSASCSKSVIDVLVQRGYAAYTMVECTDDFLIETTGVKNAVNELTDEQKNAIETIAPVVGSNKKQTFLIHGVTGSGKTEVYMRLIDIAIAKGMNAIFLVPEISLTPQMISLFINRFGDSVAVLHSKLTLRQRYNQWKKIKNGDVKIVVGARSAIFAPFSNVGLIIVDEEHETTYKSEMSPRYDAIEIARFIANQNDAVLILASATPSLQSYYKAKCGNYKLIEMPARANRAPLPKVTICDMRKELEEGNLSIFSRELQKQIEENLKLNQQSILFLNRRGHSGFVSCRSCGYVLKCPNCNVSLTYHKTSGRMVCHYCDFKTYVPQKCPSCDSRHIKFFGIGTERIVDELNKLYPSSRVLRMDADTTSGRMSHETILNSFRDGKADILVGTQMITKGLDFENVTLVGIVAADMSLSIDDYRAGERTFDLITQVSGRAGRSKKMGRAIIQTYNPDDEIIVCSSKQDYKAFYASEIEIRRMLMYPPFSEFINFTFSSKGKNAAFKKAEDFHKKLNEALSNISFNGVIFKVAESPMFMLNGKFRYHFIVKTVYKREIYEKIAKVYKDSYSSKDEVSVSIDVNPINM